jgi:hypothetical protein
MFRKIIISIIIFAMFMSCDVPSDHFKVQLKDGESVYTVFGGFGIAVAIITSPGKENTTNYYIKTAKKSYGPFHEVSAFYEGLAIDEKTTQPIFVARDDEGTWYFGASQNKEQIDESAIAKFIINRDRSHIAFFELGQSSSLLVDDKKLELNGKRPYGWLSDGSIVYYKQDDNGEYRIFTDDNLLYYSDQLVPARTDSMGRFLSVGRYEGKLTAYVDGAAISMKFESTGLPVIKERDSTLFSQDIISATKRYLVAENGQRVGPFSTIENFGVIKDTGALWCYGLDSEFLPVLFIDSNKQTLPQNCVSSWYDQNRKVFRYAELSEDQKTIIIDGIKVGPFLKTGIAAFPEVHDFITIEEIDRYVRYSVGFEGFRYSVNSPNPLELIKFSPDGKVAEIKVKKDQLLLSMLLIDGKQLPGRLLYGKEGQAFGYVSYKNGEVAIKKFRNQK